MKLLQSMVVGRLLYGLSGAWLNVADIHRFNGFQARCLRAILGISPSFISRVPNVVVLERAEQLPQGQQLRKSQLILYGRIARLPQADLRRQVTFCDNGVAPKTSEYVRRVGRPRNEWAVMLQRESQRIAGSSAGVVHNALAWRIAVESMINNRSVPVSR